MDILTLYSALKETPSEYLFYAMFIFISIWLFKEIRNTYQKTIVESATRIEKNIEIYYKALLYISSYEDGKISLSELLANTTSLVSICSKRVYKKYSEWDISKDIKLFMELKENIRNEIDFLKSEQDKEQIYWINYESIGEPIKYLINKSTVKTFLWPGLFTFFILFFGLIIFSLISIIITLSPEKQFFIIFYIAGAILTLFTFLNVINNALFRKINYDKKFIFLSVGFIVVVAIILKFLPIPGGIILIIICTAYIFLLNKYKLIKHS